MVENLERHFHPLAREFLFDLGLGHVRPTELLLFIASTALSCLCFTQPFPGADNDLVV
jgi:hypothetical protein